jgi:hypothetical protein
VATLVNFVTGMTICQLCSIEFNVLDTMKDFFEIPNLYRGIHRISNFQILSSDAVSDPRFQTTELCRQTCDTMKIAEQNFNFPILC